MSLECMPFVVFSYYSPRCLLLLPSPLLFKHFALIYCTRMHVMEWKTFLSAPLCFAWHAALWLLLSLVRIHICISFIAMSPIRVILIAASFVLSVVCWSPFRYLPIRGNATIQGFTQNWFSLFWIIISHILSLFWITYFTSTTKTFNRKLRRLTRDNWKLMPHFSPSRVLHALPPAPPCTLQTRRCLG